MINRAKCKKCLCTIESLHSLDYQVCKCGEIFVSDGEALRCGAKDWQNFIRVDDQGNEIIPTIQKTETAPTYHSEPAKHFSALNECIKDAEIMIYNIERLPKLPMEVSATYQDTLDLLNLILRSLKALS